jgi:DNA processing protein
MIEDSHSRLQLAFYLRLVQAEISHGGGQFGLESQGALLRSVGSLEKLFKLTTSEVPTSGINVLHMRVMLANEYRELLSDSAEEAIEKHRLAGVNMVALGDPAYPSMLASVRTAPPILFWRGTLSPPQSPLAAVVGTREPSPQGSEIAKTTTRYLVNNGIGVVSGLALGIDTYAHSVAIEERGYTIAVVAQPLDMNKISPARNRGLAADILDHGGAIVSEQPIGSIIEKYSFPQRDRIQSGLARVVVAIQTGELGGTQRTIQFAITQKRPVWMPLPGQIVDLEGDQKWAGNLELIRNGRVRGFQPEELGALIASIKTNQFTLW